MEYSCLYVVARLVNDPLRGEARNFGVILQCLELGYVDAQFEPNLLERLAGIAAPGDVDVVQAYIADWRSMIAGFKGASIGLPLPGPLEGTFLRTLWERYSQRVQFTEPRGCATARPEEMLGELFRQLVAEPSETEVVGDQITFRQEFTTALRQKQLMGPGRVKQHYVVEIGHKAVPVDFGYRTPKHEVLIETVDLTGGSLLDRINILSPTAVKFELAKAAKGNHVTTYSAVKTSANGHSQTVHRLELETLRKHADDVFLMSRANDKERLWTAISRDLGVAQRVGLFTGRRQAAGGSKKR
jgi:hypothetical protein